MVEERVIVAGTGQWGEGRGVVAPPPSRVLLPLCSSLFFALQLTSLFLVFGIFDPMRVIHMCEEVN